MRTTWPSEVLSYKICHSPDLYDPPAKRHKVGLLATGSTRMCEKELLAVCCAPAAVRVKRVVLPHISLPPFIKEGFLSCPVYSTSSCPVYSTSSCPLYSTSSCPVYSTSSCPVYSTSSCPVYSTTARRTLSIPL